MSGVPDRAVQGVAIGNQVEVRLEAVSFRRQDGEEGIWVNICRPVALSPHSQPLPQCPVPGPAGALSCVCRDSCLIVMAVRSSMP